MAPVLARRLRRSQHRFVGYRYWFGLNFRPRRCIRLRRRCRHNVRCRRFARGILAAPAAPVAPAPLHWHRFRDDRLSALVRAGGRIGRRFRCLVSQFVGHLLIFSVGFCALLSGCFGRHRGVFAGCALGAAPAPALFLFGRLVRTVGCVKRGFSVGGWLCQRHYWCR